MRLSRSIACALVLGALSLVARADNLVTNPDLAPAGATGYGPITGWTQSPYPSTLAGYPYLTGSNTMGQTFWNNGTAGSATTAGFIQSYPGAETDSLSQSLTLDAGQTYSYSFLENARNGVACSDCIDPTLTVDLGGSVLVGPTVITPVGDDNPFDMVSGTFIATGTSEDLSFIVNSNGDATALITGVNVNLAATPEPSSFLLLGTGLLGAAGIARRKFLRG